jgi:hypothetical protein
MMGAQPGPSTVGDTSDSPGDDEPEMTELNDDVEDEDEDVELEEEDEVDSKTDAKDDAGL